MIIDSPEMKWLMEKRGIGAQTVAKMKIYVDEFTVDDAGTRRNMVVFPYVVNGEIKGHKRRTPDKIFGATPGSKGVYNEDALDEEGFLVVVEGELDAGSVIEAGIDKVISVPDGWGKDRGFNDSGDSATEKKLEEIKDRILKADYVVAAGDNDESGKSLPLFLSRFLMKIALEEKEIVSADVRQVTWPKDCKDANDVLVKHGPAELKKRIEEAKPTETEGGTIYDVTGYIPSDPRTVLKSGISGIDDRVALELGGTSVLTGYPGQGKSTFAVWLAYQIHKNTGKKIGLFAFETSTKRIQDQIFRLTYGKPIDEAVGSPELDQFIHPSNPLAKNIYLIKREYSASIDHNLWWLRQFIHRYAVNYGCDLIIVDPWNEIDHLPAGNESLTNYINFALQQIRAMAEKLHVHIMIVAHPKKPQDGSIKSAPGGYDIADSAAFYNKPHLGLTLFKDEKKDELFLSTWKVRDVELYGVKRGFTKLLFDDRTLSYRVDPDQKLPQEEKDIKNSLSDFSDIR